MRLLPFVCLSTLSCAGYSYRPPPGPLPIPDRWVPADAFIASPPPGASGAVVLDDRNGLSPDEAAILAIDQNPSLRVARAGRGIGQAELLAARVLPNPKVEGFYSTPVSGAEAVVFGYGARVFWNVTPLLARGARVTAAEENLASIDLEIAWQEWQVAQSARLHAIRSIYLARRVEVARELEQTWSRRLDALRRAREADAVTELEVMSARRSRADARVRRLDFQQQLVAERAALNQAVGVDPVEELDLDLSFSPGEDLPARDLLLDEIEVRRLDLIALQHAHRFHDEASRAAVLARFPPVEIGVLSANEVDNVGAFGATLKFEIPFFDRNQAAIARENARTVQIEAEYETRLLEARSGTVRTLGELAAVQEQLVAAREASVAAAGLAEQARAAADSGALSPLLAADVLERSYASRLRVLQIEQLLAELKVALSLASGAHLR